MMEIDPQLVGRFFFIGLTSPVMFFVLGRICRIILPF